MKLIVKKGTASKRVDIFVQNSSVTTGAGLPDLVYNSASLTAYYWREDAANADAVAISLVTATRGTYATAAGGAGGGFIAKDATNMPGWYEFSIPDACLVTGASWCGIMLKGAANMAPVNIEIQLVSYDPEDAVRMGLTALPNAAAAAAGGLMTCTVGNVLPTDSIATASVKADAVTKIAAPVVALLPAALVGGKIDSHVNDIATGAITAAAIANAAIDNATFAADSFAAGSNLALAANEALIAQNLDHMVKIAVGTDFPTTVHADSVVGFLANKTTGVAGYARLTQSLEGAYDATMGAAEVGDAVATRVVVGGGYGATTIGGVLATNLDAPVSGRATPAQILSAPGTPIDNTGGKVLLQAAQTANITGNITGNLSGSVGSVSGAVGSVTGAVGSVAGNVGGNVAGSVASVSGNVGGAVVGAVGSVTGAVGSVTGSIGSIAFKKNTAFQYHFTMRDSTNHQPLASLAVSVQHCSDGATGWVAMPSGATISEVGGAGNGQGTYYINLVAADTNFTVFSLRLTAVGADELQIHFGTQP